ncbi:uncharacterized protein LOC142241784 [Haematobia irritans]|uniref:uncharacterized protein LOC142241784 n=1 Tax=Haematobia irritans TaxID=7368 RepID=UPI003F5046F4
MTKVWNKPLHKRKVWKQMSLPAKIVYYIRPFVQQFVMIWLQPLPFPTIFKMGYSAILFVLIILPILYLSMAFLCYYGILQFILETSLDIRFSQNLDLLHFLKQLFTSEDLNGSFWFCLQNFRYGITAVASCVDYVRLALVLLLG